MRYLIFTFLVFSAVFSKAQGTLSLGIGMGYHQNRDRELQTSDGLGTIYQLPETYFRWNAGLIYKPSKFFDLHVIPHYYSQDISYTRWNYPYNDSYTRADGVRVATSWQHSRYKAISRSWGLGLLPCFAHGEKNRIYIGAGFDLNMGEIENKLKITPARVTYTYPDGTKTAVEYDTENADDRITKKRENFGMLQCGYRWRINNSFALQSDFNLMWELRRLGDDAKETMGFSFMFLYTFKGK